MQRQYWLVIIGLAVAVQARASTLEAMPAEHPAIEAARIVFQGMPKDWHNAVATFLQAPTLNTSLFQLHMEALVPAEQERRRRDLQNRRPLDAVDLHALAPSFVRRVAQPGSRGGMFIAQQVIALHETMASYLSVSERQQLTDAVRRVTQAAQLSWEPGTLDPAHGTEEDAADNDDASNQTYRLQLTRGMRSPQNRPTSHLRRTPTKDTR